jgi:hypothetical protein
VGRSTPFEDSGRATQTVGAESGFWAFAQAGKELAALHLDYEKLEPYALKWIETEDEPGDLVGAGDTGRQGRGKWCMARFTAFRNRFSRHFTARQAARKRTTAPYMHHCLASDS